MSLGVEHYLALRCGARLATRIQPLAFRSLHFPSLLLLLFVHLGLFELGTSQPNMPCQASKNKRLKKKHGYYISDLPTES